MHRFPCADYEKCCDNIRHKGFCEFVRRAEKTADEDQIKQPKNQKCHTKRKGIGVHQRVVSVCRCFGQNRHAQHGHNRHQEKAAKFNEANEQKLPLHHIPFCNREKCREHDVICFPRRLKTLKDPQRNKKHTAKDRIARKQKHDTKSNKKVREHRCAQPHFFPDNVTHFRYLAPVLKMFVPVFHRLGKTAVRNPILAAPP